MTKLSLKNPRSARLAWFFLNSPALVTIIGATILSISATIYDFTEIQLLQAIIAILALISTSLLAERLIEGRKTKTDLEKINSQLSNFLDNVEINQQPSFDKVLTSRNNLSPLSERLNGAKRVSILGGSLGRMMLEVQPHFKDLADKKCQFRFMITNPDSEGVDILFNTVVLESNSIESYRNQVRSSYAELKLLVNLYPNNIAVKLYDYAPSFSLMMIEKENGNSIIQVEMYPFQVKAVERPMLVLDKIRDPKTFDFFYLQFESIWNSEFCKQTS